MPDSPHASQNTQHYGAMEAAQQKYKAREADMAKRAALHKEAKGGGKANDEQGVAKDESAKDDNDKGKHAGVPVAD